MDLSPNFLKHVQKTDSCWIWTASTQRGGYGSFNCGDRMYRAHRYAYLAFKGAIPGGLTIDHLCRNRLCVNPDHLEAVTKRENTLRGIGPAAQHAKQTHCKHGHPLEGDNLYVWTDGSRRCNTCNRKRGRESWARRHDIYNQRRRENHVPSPRISRAGIPHGPMAEATKEKLRRARLGTHLSEETKAKLRAANLGAKRPPRSEEQRRKMSETRRGKPGHPTSPETRTLISAKLTAAWERRRASKE